MLKKAAIFSDIHWGRKAGSDEHNSDCMRFIDWFCEQVRADPEIDHICFLGDWHEHRAAIHVNTLQWSFQGASKLNDLGLPVYFASGNHDHFMRNNSDVFSTYHFHSLENFRVLNKVTVLDEIYGGMLFIPFIQEREYPELLQYADVPVAMGHLELQGFRVTGTSNVMEHGPEAEVFFKKQKRVLSGHFHMRDTKGNVTFVGSPFAMDFSDAGDTKRGMAVYDYEKDDLKFNDWLEGPRYIKVALSDLLEHPKKYLTSGARVKVDVDTELSLEESNVLRETLQRKYKLREITLEESYSIDVELSEAETEVDKMKLETTNEVIIELLRRIKDSTIDTDLLLEIYGSLSSVSGDIASKAANVKFMELTMSNYLSYGNNTTTVNLDFSTPTLIIGRNYDSVVNGQVDSNGAGKCLRGDTNIDIEFKDDAARDAFHEFMSRRQ